MSDRGQATLVAFAAATLVVLVALTVALTVADGAFDGATREPTDARVAGSVADRLTAADGLARRENVLVADRVDSLSAETLVGRLPVLANASFRVRLGNRTLAERGDPDGATVRRLVVLARETPRTRTVSADEPVSLPRRTDRLQFAFDDASVETVRAGERVLLHDPTGLNGTTTVPVSRAATLRLRFENATGTVQITSYPTQTRKLRLVVTVDVR